MTGLTGAGSASLQDSLEGARHILGHLENDDLRGSSGFDAVRDAEIVAVPPHLDEPHCKRGQHTQMPRYVFGVFIRLDGGLGNLHFVSGRLECE